MRIYYAASVLILAVLAGLAPFTGQAAWGENCQSAVRELNEILEPRVDEKELVSILEALNETENRRLPPKFVTKAQAKKMGWKPGRDLWERKNLKGKSIGGDLFGNREGRLPDGNRVWHEADLDYHGGHRGPKRIIYSDDGLRFVTVDHYRNFKEVPPCR